MRLRLHLPRQVLIDTAVRKVRADARNGAFTLLPRHIDFVTALEPGLLAFETTHDEGVKYVAIDQGILVKCGEEVLVSTLNALHGPELGRLEQAVREKFRRQTEREMASRAAVARLEADFIRHYLHLGEAQWQMG